MSTYHIITYGCQMNEHDSENIAGLLEAMGYEHADDPSNADLVIMNTCSIRENADKRFFGVLGQFKKNRLSNPNFILAVCGCMPQQERIVEEINKSYPWVDILFGTQTIGQFPQLLQDRIETGCQQIAIIDNNPHIQEEEMQAKRLYKFKSLVNITYGCNNFCTYCIVPYTRGREKSRTVESIVDEIKSLVADGVKEVTLLGQNVDSFKDPTTKQGFAELLREVNKIEGLQRIRFMTSHPKDISDEMISCFTDCDNLCNYIHLPVQSGSNRILKRMNRHYDRERYLERIHKIREASPDITISTDIIVGFPGETEEDFEETLKLVKEVRYDSAFTFIYSPREGTPAANYDDQIPDKIAHQRFDRLVDALNEIFYEKNLSYVGKTVDVLIDGVSKTDSNCVTGRSDDFKIVNIPFVDCCNSCKTDMIGQIISVKIIEASTFSLKGELVS
ncbi:MAG: tRNA (N6-isopentenyl adenosine(37)-C2)-methylthiotransferase MiaB [Clostridiales bacterium]|nr:tRNA (N6-isopentenyl adenosine(37)-C2)-methylthiotransferase MiaB [Clostridiales bacterium]